MKNITYVIDAHVSCEGLSDNVSFCAGNPELGHPKVYLKIEDSFINCPYCNHQFILKEENKCLNDHCAVHPPSIV